MWINNMAKCPKCKHSFQVPEDEQNMHDCPSCGYDGHEPTKITYSINVWITQELDNDTDYDSSYRGIEKDIIKVLEKEKLGKVDCEVIEHRIET